MDELKFVEYSEIKESTLLLMTGACDWSEYHHGKERLVGEIKSKAFRDGFVFIDDLSFKDEGGKFIDFSCQVSKQKKIEPIKSPPCGGSIVAISEFHDTFLAATDRAMYIYSVEDKTMMPIPFSNSPFSKVDED